MIVLVAPRVVPIGFSEPRWSEPKVMALTRGISDAGSGHRREPPELKGQHWSIDRPAIVLRRHLSNPRTQLKAPWVKVHDKDRQAADRRRGQKGAEVRERGSGGVVEPVGQPLSA